MSIQAPRGTRDVLPSETYKWNYVESLFREICEKFGYKEIRTPIFEHTELFHRGVGETTDIVQKEMYSFKDNGGREITLKPEGTAPVVRSFIENKLYAEPQPMKLFYITPCFRYERPQAGRLRAFHQFGVEAFGTSNPSVDAEVIGIAMAFYKKLAITNLELRINSVGCPDCRKKYNKTLKEYLRSKLDKLCKTCQDRFDRNPMRIIDCKTDTCKEEIKDVPYMLDHICEDCRIDFEELKENLTLMEIPYTVDPTIVRGLDYYTKTAFEIVSKEIGAQGTVCGGGRYDGLIGCLGGPSTPGVGFGMGIERLLLTLQNNQIEIPRPRGLDIFIAAIGENPSKEAVKLLHKLRLEGVSADKDHMNRSLKAQFKYADKQQAAYTIVIGDHELEKDIVRLKNMDTGDQEEIKLSNIVQELKNRLK
ncbi:histidine--tRNA ligase [Geosporobacter ferrireducens]|uniref:Histidine--tRNA ligase n=1 Tax=Geosporobacter ferrireducens TaxID=1424294 RepID=A0A1D8GPE7_9FIRM|nr:histidine--tRNA ligase [Geosporobacter ferrireducens]AOT72830.1 histidine--tRNA ligase [Geosporobacter ferrireducens]MTI55228.1 histidine--tRNA ligase [Geosporobacter ferrireducens]